MSESPPPCPVRRLPLLRIVCTVAWSDGECSAAERSLLADLVLRYFQGVPQAPGEDRELAGYLAEQLPVASLADLVAQLVSEEDRELALKLAYMMIRVSRRSAQEPSINAQERVAYRKLVDLLALEEERIREIEWAAESDLPRSSGFAELLAESFGGLFGGARPSAGP